ncbi:MAG TPA: TetR/AcrR family transcriptional regulator [Clostridia bacterium]|nr:TetR/AcrR family transcriptional regulator [Clostridia bacterium]
MDGFERRRQEKKEAICYAALELFKQYGFNKVSIADIANKASVSQVSIYNFFKSKENLKKQLLNKLWNNYYQTMMSIMKSDETIQNKIEKFFFTAVDYSRNYTTNFIAESVRNQMKNEENATVIQLDSIEDVLISLLEQGKSEGVIKSTISTNAMISYIEMFRYYIINNPGAALNYDKNPELLKEMISLYLNALLI